MGFTAGLVAVWGGMDSGFRRNEVGETEWGGVLLDSVVNLLGPKLTLFADDVS